jgi:hypothetical protein
LGRLWGDGVMRGVVIGRLHLLELLSWCEMESARGRAGWERGA